MWVVAMALTDQAAALLDVPGARFGELDRLGTALRDEADQLQEEAGTVRGAERNHKRQRAPEPGP
jgi:hypothetical protein